MAELTPMMQQYREIKSRNPDCLLFFRLGDFYEMFDEDARLASRELDLTLTTRDRGKTAISRGWSQRDIKSPSASRWKIRRLPRGL